LKKMLRKEIVPILKIEKQERSKSLWPIAGSEKKAGRG